MAETTPQQRSIVWLRKQGFIVDTAERWKMFPDHLKPPCPVCHQRRTVKVRVDLFGFADLAAMHPLLKEFWLIQVTDRAHAANRMTKLRTDPKVSPNVMAAICSGIKVAVHSWALQGARGEKKRWTLKIEELSRPWHASTLGEK